MAVLVRSELVSPSGSALCCTDFPTHFELREGFLHSATLHSLDVPTVFRSSEKTSEEKPIEEMRKILKDTGRSMSWFPTESLC